MGNTGIPDIEAKVKTIARFDFNLHKHPFAAFVDRGDPGAVDFDAGDLTADFMPHTLDISSIVGTGERLVALGVFIMDDAAWATIDFFKPGIVNFVNIDEVITPAAWIGNYRTVWIMTNAAGEIGYTAFFGINCVVGITVRHWEK